jgi:hypothetical protein
MGAASQSLTWMCAFLATLPIAPCALVGGPCDRPAKTASIDETPPAHSCCAERASQAPSHSQGHPATPCPRACCRVNPIAPKVHQVMIEASALAPSFVVAVRGQIDFAVAKPTSPLLPAESLQSLRCLWRC